MEILPTRHIKKNNKTHIIKRTQLRTIEHYLLCARLLFIPILNIYKNKLRKIDATDLINYINFLYSTLIYFSS